MKIDYELQITNYEKTLFYIRILKYMFTKENLQTIFQSKYDEHKWQSLLVNLFGGERLRATPEKIDGESTKTETAFYLGEFAGKDENIGLFYYKINTGSVIHKRVGLRNLVKTFTKKGLFDAVLAVFDDGTHWRVSFISDIKGEATTPKRYTFVFGDSEQTYHTAVKQFLKLQADSISFKTLKEAFSVETLTKEFYAELSNWYFWALQNVDFPNDEKQDKEIANSTAVIRLITRLMFVWFLKQKKLIREELFDTQELEKMLNYNDKTGSTFYKAILQNLFFATLNTEMGDKRKFINRQYGIQTLYRYERFFKNKDRFFELTKDIPFLNGGLFENLDKNVGEKNEIRIDCFSDKQCNEQRLKVPDFLFFGDEKQVDLNKIYDTKGKTYKVRGLIDILKTYHFTIEENTPTDIEVALDPELLGKVFENLLASFNPETQTTARKQTGSFYTPREIVDYMVQESLTAYLQTVIISPAGGGKGVEKLKITSDGDVVIDDGVPINDEMKTLIINALNAAKILDPACGSGAFPMGILQKMVAILQKLDPQNKLWKQRQLDIAEKIEDIQAREAAIENIEEAFEENGLDYGRKLFLIENCIFGIDIQPIAVQISKLRFFISLICEQTPKPEKTNLGIRPLPNLETKFVAANTLVGLSNENLIKPITLYSLEKELKDVRHKHFSARTPETKKKYRDLDQKTRQEIGVILEGAGYSPTSAKQIAEWNPYDQSAYAEWFDMEWMFGISDGFDVVLGNPPYRQLKWLSEDYSALGFETFSKNSDIYCLFFEKGTNLLSKEGHGSFITSNKWLRTDYGKLLKAFFKKNKSAINIIDFNGYQVFETATVDTAITIWNTLKENLEVSIQQCNKASLLNELTFDEKKNLNADYIWIYRSSDIDDIRIKIEQKCKRLSECGVELNYGILTGANPIFILNKDRRDFLIDKNANISKHIVPILRGKDLEQFGYTFNDFYLLNLHNGIREKGIQPIGLNLIEDKELLEYLNSFGSDFKKRGEQGANWYNLRSCNYIDKYTQPKILYADISKDSGKFIFDENGFYTNDTAFMIYHTDKEYLKYLTAVLNSKAANFLYLSFYCGGVLGKSGMRFKKEFLSQLPIPNASLEQRQPIISLVNQILSVKKENPAADTAALEREIDLLVYGLYGLTEEEIGVIDK